MGPSREDTILRSSLQVLGQAGLVRRGRARAMVLRHLCQDIVGLQDLHQGRHHPSQLWMYVVRQWEAVEESEACNMELRIPDGRDQFQYLDGVFLEGGGGVG